MRLSTEMENMDNMDAINVQAKYFSRYIFGTLILKCKISGEHTKINLFTFH